LKEQNKASWIHDDKYPVDQVSIEKEKIPNWLQINCKEKMEKGEKNVDR
jgi:hypothetical protein